MRGVFIYAGIGVLGLAAAAGIWLRVNPAPAVLAPAPAVAHQQLWTCGMHPQVIQDHPGICPICHMKLTPLKAEDDDQPGAPGRQRKIAYWWDPMLGPASIADGPGKSAMGMDRVPVYEDQVSAGPSIRIDPAIVQNMGVLTAAVKRGPLTVSLRAVGMLEVPQPAQHDVTLKISGYIEKLHADTDGMSVKKDQVLFDLYSPDLQVAEQELISARQNLAALDAGAAPAVGAEARSFVESARRKLALWDIAPVDIDAIAAADHPPRTVPIRSPADGHVIDKAIVEGSAVPAGMKLMRIEDHSQLWLNLQIYEDQIGLVNIGQEVTAEIDGVPGKTFRGKVTFIYPHLDHMSRTEIVRTVLDNSDHQLRPGMYGSAQINTTAATDAILVPGAAVIDTGTRQIVFVIDPDSPGHFEPRSVRMGFEGDGELVQIVSGLSPGEQVVTSGQFLMDVESRTTEAINKLRKISPQPAATQPN